MSVSKLQFTPGEAAFIADLPVREVQKAFDEDWFDVVPRDTHHGTARRWLGPAELLHLRIVKDTGRYTVFPTETKKLIHKQLRERIADILLVDADNGVVIAELKPHARSGTEDTSDDLDLLASQTNVKHGFEESDEQQRLIINTARIEWVRLRSWFEQMVRHLKEPVKISKIWVDLEGAWEQMTERLAEATAAQFAVVSDPEIRGGEPVVRGTRIPVHLLQDLVAQGATYDELLADYPSLDDQRLRLALVYAKNHPRAGRPRKRPWQTLVAQ
jgi:uncharacterized protein (DUF433 family)